MIVARDRAPAERLVQVPAAYCHEKEYRTLVKGAPSDATLAKWERGIHLDGQRTARAKVARLREEKENTWLRIVLRQGRKRQIRRVALLLGHPVQRLIRERIGPLRLGDLKTGNWRHLSSAEISALRRTTALRPKPKRSATHRRK